MKKERTFKKPKPHVFKTAKDHHDDMVANLKSWVRRERELLAHDLGVQGDKQGVQEVAALEQVFGQAFDKLSAAVARLQGKAAIKPVADTKPA